MTSAAAVLICIVLGLLAVFQLLLIAGLPLGRFAWGGQDEVLPPGKRIGGVISILFYAVFAVIVLERAQLTDAIPSVTFIAVVMSVLTGYFAPGVPLNPMSRSKPERSGRGRFALTVEGVGRGASGPGSLKGAASSGFRDAADFVGRSSTAEPLPPTRLANTVPSPSH